MNTAPIRDKTRPRSAGLQTCRAADLQVCPPVSLRRRDRGRLGSLRHGRSGDLRYGGDLRHGGFSLIEVMCAIMVMGVGIVGLTVGLTTSLASSKEAERQTIAALIAAGRIETIRAEGYLIEGEETGESDVPLYQWTQSVTPGDTDGLFQVRVVVTHTGAGQWVYQLETLLFDPPVYSTLDDTDEQERRDPDA